MEQPSVGFDREVLAAVGDTGTEVGNYHLHFCVTTAPDRRGYKPFESVPVSFRNYEVSDPLGLVWTDVARACRAGISCCGARGRKVLRPSTPARHPTDSAW